MVREPSDLWQGRGDDLYVSALEAQGSYTGAHVDVSLTSAGAHLPLDQALVRPILAHASIM